MSDQLDSWWIELAIRAKTAIFAEGYFTHIWVDVEKPSDFSKATKVAALRPFQLFWEALLDSRSIHRYPFDLVCQLAEEYCCLDEEAAVRVFEQTLENAVARGASVSVVMEDPLRTRLEALLTSHRNEGGQITYAELRKILEETR